jgi:hypothetical protein
VTTCCSTLTLCRTCSLITCCGTFTTCRRRSLTACRRGVCLSLPRLPSVHAPHHNVSVDIQVLQLLTEMGTIDGDIFARPTHDLGPDKQNPPLCPHVSTQIKRKEGVMARTLDVLGNTESGILPNFFESRVLRPRADWTLPIQLASIPN